MVLAIFSGMEASQAKSASRLSDAQVKQQIIEESIDSYSGNCACPFNTASNGSRCGKRSAWSRPGGASPVCYANEITAEMIKAWREEHGSD
ncbi:hypothetical protein [Kalamiella sp. sgz302252]|uniref:hypothetical protein n=1 Tax=Pantoea sp. sgz302252 TaxID=3341827 RepID=UPI0036D263AB